MKTNFQTFLIASLVVCLTTLSFTFAQNDTNTSSSTVNSTSSQVDIAFPVQKDDFLLFYGLTKDDTTNAKISDLRKDFASKFGDLKDQYQKSFTEITGDKEVSFYSASTSIKEIKSTVSKVTKSVKSLKVDDTVKKYIINSDQPADVITPVVNLINNQSLIHTENSSWFQKVKTFFNW
ncbi:MAG: hypothetical protein WCO35_03445 [Candidatus Nomurabacteria bacterium]